MLLNATIECLVEHGFEGCSTPIICRKAGVSRGAQLHHYPTKMDLLVAAVEHLCDRRHAEFRQLVEAEGSSTERVNKAFDDLWQIYSGPTLSAWIELVVAARTDPALREQMNRVSGRLEEEAEATLRELFGIDSTVPARAAVRMVLSLLDGLALRNILQGEDSSREALTVFRALVEPWLLRGASQ
jgi:AcrR family transcriptional regulator